MHFKSKCKLPFTSIDSLLELLRLICPQDSLLPKSVYYLRKFFTSLGTTQDKKEYCSYCANELGNCSCTINSKGEPDCFIHLDTVSQFKTILSSKLVFLCSHF